MPARPETILATLPGADDNEQVVVVLMQAENGQTHIELRQQSWGEGLGWYNQSSVQIDSSQVAGLRQALGLGGACGKVRTRAFASQGPANGGFVPRVVHADAG